MFSFGPLYLVNNVGKSIKLTNIFFRGNRQAQLRIQMKSLIVPQMENIAAFPKVGKYAITLYISK